MTGTRLVAGLLTVFLWVALGGCASSRDEAANLTQDTGWRWSIISTDKFDLASAQPSGQQGRVLWVYIEGDGRAFLSSDKPSSDPTPSDPLALRLALINSTATPVAYLARPCQYTLPEHARNCAQSYWTNSRYAPAIIDAINQALDILKNQVGAVHLVLVGYSGGGAVAVLAAAKRKDVIGIVTVAANLDLAYWTQHDQLTSLKSSLDPADFAGAVASIPQIHFTGSRDDTTGTDVVRSFMQKLPPQAPARLIEIPDFTHKCCWAEEWPKLIASLPVQSILKTN